MCIRPDPQVCLQGFVALLGGRGGGQERVSGAVFYLCSNDEGDSVDSLGCSFSSTPRIPMVESCPFQKLRLRGSPVSGHTPLHEKRGQSASLQQLTPWWAPVFRPLLGLLEVKPPRSKAVCRLRFKGRQAGNPREFQRPCLGPQWSAPQVEKIASFSEVNIFTGVLGEAPVNRRLWIISEGITRCRAHCLLCLHRLRP